MRGPRTLCSIRVYNPGGGGGGPATVSTDGVTIQGDGSTGNKIALKQVETDATLSGAGTLASTLQVVPGSGYIQFNEFTAGGQSLAGNNQVWVELIFIPGPWTLTKLWVNVGTADAVGLYDIGLYSAAGTRLAHIGAQTLPSTGFQGFSVVGSPVALASGAAYWAFTGNSTSAALLSAAGAISGILNHNYATSASGVLPASVTAFSGPAPAAGCFWKALS